MSKNQLKFSVLMSVYYKEKPDYLKLSIESILNQTVCPNEVVIVKDGYLNDSLDEVIEYYIDAYPDIFKIVQLKENRGLGLALAEGILHCSNELVARMDSDDISVRTRFEKQLDEFNKNPELDICGSYIAEFESNPEIIKDVRKVPLCDKEIKQYQKKRDGFNHVSVMFKKGTVLKAGNYQDALLMEDSLLWINMFKVGAVGMNIGESLVLVRAGDDMIERRGGYEYFLKYKEGRKKIKATGYISNWDYYQTLAIQLIVALVPKKIRVYIFKNLLRNK